METDEENRARLSREALYDDALEQFQDYKEKSKVNYISCSTHNCTCISCSALVMHYSHTQEKRSKKKQDAQLQSRLVRAGKESMLQALGQTAGNKKKKASGSVEGESPPKRKTGSRRLNALSDALAPIAAVLKMSVEATDRHAQRMSAIAQQNLVCRQQHLQHQREQAKIKMICLRESNKFDRILAAVAAGMSFQEAAQLVNNLTESNNTTGK